jgi:hypothetical protein
VEHEVIPPFRHDGIASTPDIDNREEGYWLREKRCWAKDQLGKAMVRINNKIMP